MSGELVEAVQAALARLSPSHHEILVLRDLDGMSGPATADELGLSLSAMKSRLVRARAALRAEILAHPQVHPAGGRRDRLGVVLRSHQRVGGSVLVLRGARPR